jgi:hypothetical protein
MWFDFILYTMFWFNKHHNHNNYLSRLVYELVLPYLLPLVLLAFPYVCLLGKNLSQCWGSGSGTACFWASRIRIRIY